MKAFRILMSMILLVGILSGCLSTNDGTASVKPGIGPAAPTKGSDTPAGEIIVAAAADLQFAFTEIANNFEQETGHSVNLVFGSTGQLAQQIANGAPYDLLASADRSYVDRLSGEGKVVKDSIALYARGRIVLAVNRKSGLTATDLSALTSPQIKHIAIANPAHAPYGLAAQQALQAVGIWDEVQSKLVYGENVRQALQYIQTGDAEVGIIALSVTNVPEITWTLIDGNLHDPLDQALAVVSTSKNQELARQFAAFINGETGRPIMRKYGFVLPGEQFLVENTMPDPTPMP